MSKRTCAIDVCERPADGSRGWCQMHYRRFQRHGDPLATSRIVGDDDARFRSHIEISPDGCWLWTAALNQDGYAWFSVASVPCLGHRWSWERVNGPVPEELELDHLCRTRRCVRDDHLEPVPHRTNVLRGESFAAVNAVKDTCPQGHRYTLNPTNGRRECKPCARENDRSRSRR